MASPNLNFVAQDHDIFDKKLSVTLTSRAGSTTSGLTALKETVSSVIGNQGGFSVITIKTRWHLFVDELSSTVPEENGYITDPDSVKHYIDFGGVEIATWDTRYVCTTTAQVRSEVYQ